MSPAAWGRRVAGRAALLVGFVTLLFVLVCVARDGVCLRAYAWQPGVGYAPSAERCAEAPGVVEGIGFAARATGGALIGRSGRSREDATRSLAGLLWRRGARSAGVFGIALLILFGIARFAPRRALPGGLPLPVAGFAVFALVLRLTPPGSALDYDRAGILWAGLALALADGVARVLVDGLRGTRERERRRPWAEHHALLGVDPEPTVAEVTAPQRALQVRGALVGLLGGLVVVEAIFGVNGLGETLKDLVVDSAGLDALLLLGVLGCFAAVVLLIDLLPIERALS